MAKEINFNQGILVLRSKNSNFNADFSGNPRTLPDENGTIYATDKSLKYCIRKYIHDLYPKESVFVWRRHKQDGQPCDLEENYNLLFKKGSVFENLLSCIDVRLFGVTYAVEKNNLSITGPVQISYGINKMIESSFYPNQILSPYRNSNDKSKKKLKATTGSETKALEAHYVFDYTVNPNAFKSLISERGNKGRNIEIKDLEIFKNAMSKGVNYVNSCSKIGSESELFLNIELKDNIILPLLKDKVKISKVGEKTEIDLSELLDVLSKYNKKIEKAEIYYDQFGVELKGLNKVKGIKIEIKDIISGDPVK